jgi:hypothetical protein
VVDRRSRAAWSGDFQDHRPCESPPTRNPQRHWILSTDAQADSGLAGISSVIDEVLEEPAANAPAAPVNVYRDGKLGNLRAYESVARLFDREAAIPRRTDASACRLRDDTRISRATPPDDVPGWDWVQEKLVQGKRVPGRPRGMYEHLAQERLIVGAGLADDDWGMRRASPCFSAHWSPNAVGLPAMPAGGDSMARGSHSG